MKKTIALITLTCLVAPTMVYAYPLEDSEFLKSAYCFHMAYAPRLEVDLSKSEQEAGQASFFSELYDRGLEFPLDKDYQAIKKKYIQWVVARFRNEPTGAALEWYRNNCVSN